MNTQNYQKLDRAKAQVAEIKGFYSHLTIYLIFVCVFITLNVYSGGFFWAIFPIAGWGLGVLGHANNTFNWNPLFSKDWEERKIKEIMNKNNF